MDQTPYKSSNKEVLEDSHMSKQKDYKNKIVSSFNYYDQGPKKKSRGKFTILFL